MYTDDEVAEFPDARCLKETARAILVRCLEQEAWIPKSQLREGSEVLTEGDEGNLVVALWFAEKEGLFE
jgi:hypothetical protein